MIVLRPVQESDIDALMRLAEATAFSLTTLPRDRSLLAARVSDALAAFAKVDHRPRGESFLFVLEDLAAGAVIGTSGVVSKVGGFEPFYAYRLETTLRHSPMLGVRKEIQTLHLVAEHNGPCEICSLFLDPAHRGGGRGRLLSLGRFLFMADHAQRFDPLVIAELRGVVDARGRSPFWDALGRHFFEIEFPRADHLSMVNKRFIADLMPKHPIYVSLLPEPARAAIGQVHELTRPALGLLHSEGFSLSGTVDIFDAGPVLSCPLDQIRAVRESRVAAVAAVADRAPDWSTWLLASTRPDFRACQAPAAVQADGSVHLDRATAGALDVAPGEAVRMVAPRAAAAAGRTRR